MAGTKSARDIFLEALDQVPADRAAYLDEACGGDAALRQRVEALLRAHDDPGAFLSEAKPGASGAALPPVAGGATVDSEVGQPETEDYGDPTARVGSVVAGKYKLIEEIGEGGMGSVYMAQQQEPVKRAVAVKVIKAGMDSRAVLARFEAERQALAMMDHPNIARVLDAGTTDGGRPFFVMELVKGTPITRYCDEHKLTPRQRLELFVPVCQAIQHAHQKGVIHRDIKPSNVLVAMYDDRPVPKVIDFGVAKAAGQSLTDKTLMTGFGALVGTPEYMSPEQANLNNLDIDTRSDVYSLGVLLYELLTGTTPVDKQSLGKAALLEVLRIVRKVEAPRPSAKLSAIDTLPSVAANRGTEPAKLSRLMKRELDWLVLKALEKDRTRRYDTANGLARDIQRYLADEVVEARPPSVGYRVSKFVRRHKGQVIAASLVLFALLAGMIGTTWGLIEASRQEQIARDEASAKEKARQAEAEQRSVAEVQREKADEEKKIAQAVRDFLQNKLLAQTDTGTQADALLKAGESSSGAKLNPTIRELLDRAAQELAPDKIEESFPKQPLLQAELLQTIGRTYRGIGEYQPAIEFLKRSEALRRQHLGPEDLVTLDTMNNLAEAYWGAAKRNLALPLLEETLKLRKAKLGPEHPDTLTSMNNLAVACGAAGKLDLALPLLEETLKLRRAKLGLEHPDTLASMNGLAWTYLEAGKRDLALPLFEETLRLRKAKLGLEHPDTLTSMHDLAEAYQAAGKLDLALPLLEETLKLRKAKLGPEHPDTLINMGSLAWAYKGAGKPDLALPLFEETLKLFKAKLGPEHPGTLRSMSGLAGAYQAAGKLDLALPLFEDTLKLFKAKLGPEHPKTLRNMNGLAVVYRDAGKLDLALPLFEETLKLRKATLGPEHPDTLDSMNNLASAYLAEGQLAKAVPLLEEMLAKRKAKLGAEHPQTLGTMANLGLVLLQQKKWAEAEPVLRDCLAIRQKQIPDSWLTFNTQSMLGGALLGQKKYAQAEPLLVKGYEGMKTREKTIPKTGGAELCIPEALDRLIELYTAINKPDEAKKWQAGRAKYATSAPPSGKK